MNPRYLEDYTGGEIMIFRPFRLSGVNLLSFDHDLQNFNGNLTRTYDPTQNPNGLIRETGVYDTVKDCYTFIERYECEPKEQNNFVKELVTGKKVVYDSNQRADGLKSITGTLTPEGQCLNGIMEYDAHRHPKGIQSITVDSSNNAVVVYDPRSKNNPTKKTQAEGTFDPNKKKVTHIKKFT